MCYISVSVYGLRKRTGTINPAALIAHNIPTITSRNGTSSFNVGYSTDPYLLL
jgi:hypothetical protein